MYVEGCECRDWDQGVWGVGNYFGCCESFGGRVVDVMISGVKYISI